MQLITTIVGLSIGASAMPMVMQMAITPAITQVRTNNFGVAETTAVTYAALNEGQEDFTEVPKSCELSELGNEAYKVTCTEGKNQFKATVTRAFRNTGNAPGGYSGNKRVFDFATPGAFEPHQCPAEDPWGVQYTNDQWQKNWNWGACTPSVLWNKNRYLASNPDDWLYDISEYGFGQHPDY